MNTSTKTSGIILGLTSVRCWPSLAWDIGTGTAHFLGASSAYSLGGVVHASFGHDESHSHG